MKKLFAFSLSELLISLAVLGIICAIVVPAIVNNAPNQNKMMMKKAYYLFNGTIEDLIKDTSIYPPSYQDCPEKLESGYIGFDCNDTPAKLPYYFSKNVNLDERIISELSVFKNDSKYQASGSSNCIGESSCYKLKTSDNIIWAFSSSELFTKGNADSYTIVGFDVNGDKAPNCYQGNTSSCPDREKNFDQLRLILYADGGIEIEEGQTWAKNALSVSSSLSGDD